MIKTLNVIISQCLRQIYESSSDGCRMWMIIWHPWHQTTIIYYLLVWNMLSSNNHMCRLVFLTSKFFLFVLYQHALNQLLNYVVSESIFRDPSFKITNQICQYFSTKDIKFNTFFLTVDVHEISQYFLNQQSKINITRKFSWIEIILPWFHIKNKVCLLVGR